MKNLEGVFVAMVTPFIGERVNRDAIARIIEFYQLKELNGALVCGSTGEAHLLTNEQIKEVIKFAVEYSKNDFKIIAGILRSDTESVIEMAKYAEDVGADAVLVVIPFYYKFNEDEVRGHYEVVKSRIDIPLLLYNVPVFTGVNFSPEIIANMITEGIIDGIKDTVNDLTHFMEIVYRLNHKIERSNERPSLFIGTSKLFLPALLINASGGILASANYIPELSVKIYESVKRNNIEKAKEYQKELSRVCSAIEGKFGIKGIKAAMEIRGLPSGAPKKPFKTIEEHEYNYIRKVLDSVRY